MKYAAPLLLIATLGLAACGDSFVDVQSADTIEAYEEFLTNNPDTRFKMEAEDRLETLYLEKARTDGGLEGYDKYLERFPEGNQIETAHTEREGQLFVICERENTKESWQRWLDEYPKGKPERRKKAKRMLHVHSAGAGIEIGPVEVTQVNLAEDPEGPLDGWSITSEVTNNSKKTFETVVMTVNYLDENGRKISGREWGLAMPYWKVPMPDIYYKPFKPGETRTWEWTTGNLPEGWARKVTLYTSNVKVASADGK